MQKVAEILEHVCPCGGDPSGLMHQESLLHRRWLLGQGLQNHDPLEDSDRRHLEARTGPIPSNVRHDLR